MTDTRVKSEHGWKDAKGTVDGLTRVAEGGTLKTYSTNGAAAISKATTVGTDFPGREWKLKYISVTFSSAPTTSENLTVTLANPNPNRPDTVWFSTDPSATAATSVLKTWEDGGLRHEAGQEVTLAYTNTDTRTVKADIVVEVM